jgi:hypothetical protein
MLNTGLKMKTKSLVVLQALLLMVGTVPISGYAEVIHNDGTTADTDASQRPGAAAGSQKFYDAISQTIKEVDDKGISFKNEFSKEIEIVKADLDGKFSTWISSIRDMQVQIVKDCEGKQAGEQLDELIRGYVSELSTELAKVNAAAVAGDSIGETGEKVVNVKGLYAVTSAIKKVFAELEAKNPKDKKKLQARSKALLAMFDKTNAMLSGFAEADLPEAVKTLDLSKVVSPAQSDSEAVQNDEKRTLELVVKEASEAEGKACLFALKNSNRKNSGKKPDEDPSDDSSAAALSELTAKLDAEKKAREALEKKHAEEIKKEQDRIAEIQKNFSASPAQGGNAPGGPGAPGTGDSAGGPGDAGAGAGGAGGGSGAPDPNATGFANLNGFAGNGLNGGLGDLLALKDQFQRDLDDQLAEQQALDALRLQQLAQPQIPSFNSKSVSPAPPAPATPLPPIPPVSVGTGSLGGPPPYPPMGQPFPPMMPPMQPYPQQGPPQPVAFKTETTETTEEGFVPNPTSMIPPIQQPIAPPQPPTIVNDIMVTVRLPNGQVTTMPLSQVPTSGGQVLSTNNPFGGTQLTNTGTATQSTGTSNVSGLASAISSVDTSRRSGSTNATGSGSTNNINSSNPNGRRGGLTF